MTHRRIPQVSSRKEPKQSRSAGLVATILEAAAQVLAKEGAARFTTGRVAERAGISIGSLYQYFPNKAAILFRLQSDEWRRTRDMLRSILQDAEKPPAVRLRILVHEFIRSECEEAQMRGALSDAAPFYRDAPEALEARAAGEEVFHRFMHEVMPDVAGEKRQLAGDLLSTTLSAFGRDFSATPRTAAEIKIYADALADMFTAYVQGAV
ncbi:TetR family transcriptional regulator [Rahnella perminowiae]|uniref:TetR family transcriptional regulator n=1 Tax=Rahnella perminowiae TaxID=2816244 RepID=UPI0036669DD1